MFKKFVPLALILFSSFYCIAQTSEVSGKISDTTSRAAVNNAVVAFLTPKDSMLVKFARTDGEGNYRVKGIDTGQYIVMVMHPTFADFVDNVTIASGQQVLPGIPVTPKSKLLEAVIIKSGSPIRIKGDTTVYTADSFNVSANANVEELLKKLPGIQVDKNGQITAMGKTVEKVLVDGEEFFGDDPGMAVKNLRADAVKEVQVFDKKSEQSEFTGIDDGQTQKTINLKLKDDKKKGYFGKIDLAGGLQDEIDDRYNTNLMYSSFKGKRKLTGFVLSGNTGQDGLSWQDSEKFGGQDDNISMSMDEDGGVMYMWSGGTSDDEPYVNTQDGFIKNINAGAQYSNKWDDKKTLNFSPKYNEQVYHNDKLTFRQEQLKDAAGNFTTLNENSSQTTDVDRHNVKLRGSYDIKIDTSNSLKITANANFYNTRSVELSNSSKANGTGDLINTRNALSKYSNDKYALSGNAIFRHKFKKARRTLSFNADWSLLNTDGLNFLETRNEIFSGPNTGVYDVDQMLDFHKVTNKVTTRAVYTEPLSTKLSLEVAHEYSKTAGTNDQVTYSKTPGTSNYKVRVDSLTNEFETDITINKPSLKLNYSFKKIKFNLGAGFGLTAYDLQDKTFNKTYERNFTNFFPNANFTYTYKSNHSVRLNYNGNTTQPSINQLQPLRNNTDKFNQYIGNPDLKPSFSNNFNLSHNSYNFIKDRWMYQSLNVSTVSNSIRNNRVTNLSTGETITQPINTNGNLNINLWSGLGFKMKKINTRLNINPNLSYSQYTEVIQSVASRSKNTNAGLSLGLYKTKDKKYDVSLSNNFSYNTNRNSQSNTKFTYNTNTVSSDVTIYIKKVWSIQTDYSYFYRQKTTAFDENLNNQLWNARLQRTFKKNEFTVYLRVRDILNDNIGVQRNFSGNMYTETQNDRLKRYWMLGFTWDFKNKGAAPAPAAK